MPPRLYSYSLGFPRLLECVIPASLASRPITRRLQEVHPGNQSADNVSTKLVCQLEPRIVLIIIEIVSVARA
jgi:hypothetical protein